MNILKPFLLFIVLVALAGCAGEQSAFIGLGPVASRISLLMWIMLVAAALITVLMCTLVLVAITGSGSWRRALTREKPWCWAASPSRSWS